MTSNTVGVPPVNENVNNQDFIDLRNEDINSNDQSFGIDENTSEPVIKVKEKPNLKTIGIVVSVALLVLIGIYLGGVLYFKSHYLPNTTISGFNSSFQSPASVEEKLEQISHVRKVSLVGKDMVVDDIKAEDIGLNLTDSVNYDEILNSQNPYLWPLYLFHAKKNEFNQEHSIDDNMLNDKLNSLSIISGEQVVPTENARAEFNGDTYEVKKEVYGTNLNLDAVKNEVKTALENGQSEIKLDETDCYIQPVLKYDNQNLIDNVAKLNTLVNETITYDFKTAQETIDKNTFSSWLQTNENGDIVVDDNQVNAYIQGLADKYDTLGKEQTFTTSGGREIIMTDWYNGWELDKEGEAAALKENLLSGQSITKEPLYSSTGRDRAFGNKVAGTYLEISIGDQTMWFYKDNELLVSTPVVTGDVTQGYGTPTGLYVVQAKSMNVVLRGNNADGSNYESPVTFWIPFNGGIGVHDASWRGSYGGSIYLGNGSHGCVNTPYSAVKTIYNNIAVGDTVVVY